MLKNKSIFRSIRHVLTCLTFSFLCLPASANLLINSSFEQPIASDGPPFVGSWEAFNGSGNASAAGSLVMPRSGTLSVAMAIHGEANTFAGIFQDVDGLVAGQSVIFSGWNRSLLEQGGIEIRIEYRNMINDFEVSRTSNLVPTPGTDYSQFILSSMVPLGADGARVVYAIQSFTGAVNQLVYVDDFSFVVVSDVPEPSILALFCIGLIGLRFTHRQ
jgi:hypothetical protein